MKSECLEKIWDEFADIPINDIDELEEDFYWWEKGTDRFAVWDWFDEKLPHGLAEWIGEGQP